MKLTKDEETLKQIASLVEYAFLKKEDLTKDPVFMSRYKNSIGFGEYHDGKLASYIMVNTFESYVNKKKVKMGAIGYVASSPENRGKGDISRLMKEVLRYFADNDYGFSNLAPFSESFYAHYGYANAIYQQMLLPTNEALKGFKPLKEGTIKRGSLNDSKLLEAVKELHKKALENGSQRNTVSRPDWWWERMDQYYDHPYVFVYFDEDDTPKGYMIYQIKQQDLIVREFYFETIKAAKGLLSIIASHSSMNLKYQLVLAEKSMVFELFDNQNEISKTIRPYMMSRIVYFEQIAQAMKFKHDGKLIIEISNDDIIDKNNGLWKLDFYDGKMHVDRAQLMPNYKGSIEDWTKILLGHLTLKQAIKLGFIKQNIASDVEFVKGDIDFYDYF